MRDVIFSSKYRSDDVYEWAPLADATPRDPNIDIAPMAPPGAPVGARFREVLIDGIQRTEGGMSFLYRKTDWD